MSLVKEIRAESPGAQITEINTEVFQATPKMLKLMKFVKFAKGTFIVLGYVGAAVDLYEVYTAQDRGRTLVKKAGGWTGGLATAWAVGEAAAVTGNPGIVLLAGLGGFAFGYFLGDMAGEAIYDYYIKRAQDQWGPTVNGWFR